MMHRKLNKWMLFLCLVFAGTTTQASSRIDFFLTESGDVDAVIVIPNSELVSGLPSNGSKRYGLTLLTIPFQENESWVISKPQDVSVSVVASNDGYSILAVTLPPSNTEDLMIEIDKAFKLEENREGKSKISLNLSYPLMTQPQREILDLSFSHSKWDISFNLLSKYEDDEVSKAISQIARVGDKKFEVSYASISALKTKEVWLVFPNAHQKALDTVKLVISLFFGVVTLFAQVPFIRGRKLSTVSIILIVSLLGIGVSGYYIFKLSKGFELAVWGAALIPHFFFSLGGAIYVLVARAKQASVAVTITLDEHRSNTVK